MNPILLSFLCGAAFIGGAVAVVFLVMAVLSARDTKAREELREFWKTSLNRQAEQVAILERMAVTLARRQSDRGGE